MTDRAVIFDLFGTLIDNFSYQEHDEVLTAMAAVLGVRRADFARLWYAIFKDRAIGIFATTEANIKHCCQTLGVGVEEQQVASAAVIRVALTQRYLQPRPGILPVLQQLREKGYKIGLISDCSSEVVNLWPTTPFVQCIDVAIFSCEVGTKKPDPAIYLLACQRLGVGPQECLYVGDGGSQELAGAAAAGMHSVLIGGDSDTDDDLNTIDAEVWTGPRISTIEGVLTLIELR